MSVQAAELASIAALTLAAALGALIILPRPKPEPPPDQKQPAVESVIESEDLRPATQRVEPLSDAQRVDNLDKKLNTIEIDVQELKELVRLQQAVNGEEKRRVK